MNPTRWLAGLSEHSEFLSPSTIVGGRGSAVRLAELLRRRFGLEQATVLVAADDIVVKAGMADALLGSLEDAGFRVILQTGFGSEPTAEVIDAAAARVRDEAIGAVIGIGGGSVLDASKILSLLIVNGGGCADWIGPVDPPQGLAPLILIPTTCGTGSEATRIAMVTVDGAKRAVSCPAFVPPVAVIDPDLVATLPRSVVASTGMDALAHAIESLMSTSASPMSSHHAFTAIELIVTSLEKAAEGDPDAQARCLWASHLAGQALNAGVVLGHSLAYCLSFEHPMPHGTSCALALPYCLAYNQHLDPSLAAALAASITSGRSRKIKDAALEVMQMAGRLGLPVTLDEAQIPEGVEGSMAARCVSEYPRPTNPRPLERSALEQLLAAMRTGDLDAAFAVTVAEHAEAVQA